MSTGVKGGKQSPLGYGISRMRTILKNILFFRFLPFVAVKHFWNNTMENAIIIENASVYMDENLVLKNISWTLEKGARCFLMGANGAGKTTLVKLLMGFAWPVYGARVEILGNVYGKCNLQEVRKKIGWVSPFMQHWTSENSKALHVVLSGLDGSLGLFRDVTKEEVDRAMEILTELNAAHLAERSWYALSSGEQVKFLIARALITSPELLILDEPSVYMDLAGREYLLSEIERFANSRPDLTLIFITQRIEEIMPVFKYGMALKNGTIYKSGSTEEVLTEENLEQIFNIPVKLLKSDNGRFWPVVGIR